MLELELFFNYFGASLGFVDKVLTFISGNSLALENDILFSTGNVNVIISFFA